MSKRSKTKENLKKKKFQVQNGNKNINILQEKMVLK